MTANPLESAKMQQFQRKAANPLESAKMQLNRVLLVGKLEKLLSHVRV